jgi:carboxyl-terminal processing protease
MPSADGFSVGTRRPGLQLIVKGFAPRTANPANLSGQCYNHISPRRGARKREKDTGMSSLTKKVVVMLSVIVFGFVAVGYVRGRSSDDKAYRALTVYGEVLDRVQREYTDYKEKSAANPKAEAGLALTKRFGYISVISALPDSPAEKAGLQLGDVLEKIAGFTTGQMAIEQAQLLLSGDPGTVVKLSVIRRGKAEPKDMEITLAKLPAPKLVEDKLEGDIAYLRVPEFQAGATKQIRDDLAQFEHQGAHKLILDLRDCALGDDQEGISTAQLFLPSGTITSLKGQTMAAVVSSADASKVAWTQPLTVLIDTGTAGAAEILAGAIADNHRGETVGIRTYGTASQQKLIQLEDGSALILTLANYYTPAGKEIPVEGVAPTREVRPAPEDVTAADQYPPAPSSSPTDPDIKKAIEILQGAAAPRKAA